MGYTASDLFTATDPNAETYWIENLMYMTQLSLLLFIGASLVKVIINLKNGSTHVYNLKLTWENEHTQPTPRSWTQVYTFIFGTNPFGIQTFLPLEPPNTVDFISQKFIEGQNKKTN